MLNNILVLLIFLAKFSNAQNADKVAKSRSGDSGSCGKYTKYLYTITRSKKLLNISGIGDMDNYLTSSDAPYYKFISEINSIYISNGVTSIGDYAFAYYDSLETIVFSDTLRYIGKRAFSDCKNLRIIDLYKSSVTTISDEAFINCVDLTELYLPKTLISIGKNAFKSNSIVRIHFPNKIIGDSAFEDSMKLQKVEIGINVEKIGYKCFFGSNSLISIDVDENNKYFKSIDGILFNKDGSQLIYFPEKNVKTSFIIPDSVKVICDYAVYNNNNLKSITIGNNVNEIGIKAFSNTFIDSVVIPNSVTYIGAEAFAETYVLSSLTIGSGLKSMDSSSFSICPSLSHLKVDDNNKFFKSINNVLYTIDGKTIVLYPAKNTEKTFRIPDTVTTIPNYTFCKLYYCFYIEIPKSVVYIGEKAFIDCSYIVSYTVSEENAYYTSVNGILYDKKITTMIQVPQNVAGHVSIPVGILSIDDYKFSRCKITSITIPDKLTRIGSYAFQYCTSLESISFGNDVTSIGRYAFQSCIELTSIIFPKSLLEIGNDCFY